MLLTAVALNPALRLMLRRRGTSAATAWVLRHSEAGLADHPVELTPAVITEAKGVGALVNRAAAQPAPAVTCLTRSLTAQYLLRRRGIRAELRIGVRPNDDPVVSGRAEPMLFHAWVEVGDVVINDVLDVGTTFATFPVGAEQLAGFR